MNSLAYYFNLYRGFISVSFAESIGFRTSFVLLILMDLFFYSSTLLTVSFIYDHVETIGPWGKSELMFFIAFMLALDHLHMTFLSESFWYLSRHIRLGDLDYILLRPANSLFSVFFRYIRPSTMCNTPIVWGFLIYFGVQAELSILQWALIPPLLLMAFALLAILEFIIATAMFWMTEGLGINFLRMQLQSLGRWPDFIYHSLSRKFFLVFMPILLVGSAPIRFLYDYSEWTYMLGMLCAIIVFWKILNFIWQKALNQYESASS